MLFTIVSVGVSITLTVEAPSLLTYTLRPSGVMTMPCGPWRTGIVPWTRFVPISTTATAMRLKIATQAFGAAVGSDSHGTSMTSSSQTTVRVQQTDRHTAP